MGGMHLPDLTACDRLASAVLAERTIETYASDWRLYSNWCASAGREPLPSSTDTINLYVTQLLDGHKVKTVRRHLWAILNQHRLHGFTPPDFTKSKAILVGTQRLRGEQPVQKHAISVAQLREMISRIDLPEPRRTRDRAVLLFGFATALRRSNIVSARLEHIRFTEQGMIVHVPREKQDQIGKGRDIGVPLAANAEVCAVRALREWLRLRGTEPGYLFDGLRHDRWHPEQRMNHNTVGAIVKRAAESIGLDPAHYGGHSLRAGFATAALESGAGEILTARHTGHRSLTCLRMYLRGNDPFRGNVLGVIGL
jgi:integrase